MLRTYILVRERKMCSVTFQMVSSVLRKAFCVILKLYRKGFDENLPVLYDCMHE